MANIHQLLQVLQSRPEVDEHIAVLHELNTALTMASGHPSQNRVGGVIQALVPLLAVSNNEVVLLAIRALITCIDITPRAASSLVEGGALRPMCRRLLEIEDMDVAEACLNKMRWVQCRGSLRPVSAARSPTFAACERQILPFLRECLMKQTVTDTGEHIISPSGSSNDLRGGSGAAGSAGGAGAGAGAGRAGGGGRGGGGVGDWGGAGGASQMASLCLERLVVSFSTPLRRPAAAGAGAGGPAATAAAASFADAAAAAAAAGRSTLRWAGLI
eukprot:jgi/Undpi1/7667/HiC_scaffold_23.g10140.m1